MFNIKKILSSQAILYVFSRYLTYGIQLVTSFFVAIKLGPYYLGIWGFINLVLGYLHQLNFGIQPSINVILATEKNKQDYAEKVVGNGLVLVLSLVSVISILGIVFNYFDINIGSKYSFNQYLLFIVIIIALYHINLLFSNVLRIYGDVLLIAINQSIYPILLSIILPFFSGEALILSMLILYAISYTFTLILFLLKFPIKLRILIDLKILKTILHKGWFLFVYNTSFFLILLSTKSFISGNYSVSEFGFFTFSYSLANVVLLLLNSLNYLVFPKIINRFSIGNNSQIAELLNNVRMSYISLSHLLIHLIILIYPLLIVFLPEYSQSTTVFKLTALTIVLNANSFGYQSLLIAKKMERIVALIAFSILILNVTLCYFLIIKINVPFDYAIIATMISYLIYVFVLAKLGRKSIGLRSNNLSVAKDVVSIKLILPYITSLSFVFLHVSGIFFVIPLLTFVILNIKDIKGIFKIAKNIINNPSFINI